MCSHPISVQVGVCVGGVGWRLLHSPAHALHCQHVGAVLLGGEYIKLISSVFLLSSPGQP